MILHRRKCLNGKCCPSACCLAAHLKSANCSSYFIPTPQYHGTATLLLYCTHLGTVITVPGKVPTTVFTLPGGYYEYCTGGVPTTVFTVPGGGTDYRVYCTGGYRLSCILYRGVPTTVFIVPGGTDYRVYCTGGVPTTVYTVPGGYHEYCTGWVL